MHLLFLTTYNVSLDGEHYFTINVWNALCKYFNSIDGSVLSLATIFEKDSRCKAEVKELSDNGHQYYQYYISSYLSMEEKVNAISDFFKSINPSVIHSNMVEFVDVLAANQINIPIILTIHIGGFICPRGGGNGFLKFDDSICDKCVGDHCIHCCSQDLPFRLLSYGFERLIPNFLKSKIASKIKNKNVFYITPFIGKYLAIQDRKKAIKIYKNATIIAANYKLREILALNGLKNNVVVIPHGVQFRPRLDYPVSSEIVKFYFLGRIQYSKGLHNLLRAFEGIDKSKYELHIIGDAEKSGTCQRYFHKVEKLFSAYNVVYHGRLPNDKIESVIKDMHVMVHPTFCLEVYGIAIAESLSLGRPVLATRCGGAEMQIRDGVNGWLVEPNNVSDLHQKIVSIIEHRDQLVLYSQRCHLPHSVENYTERLYETYRHIEGGE